MRFFRNTVIYYVEEADYMSFPMKAIWISVLPIAIIMAFIEGLIRGEN